MVKWLRQISPMQAAQDWFLVLAGGKMVVDPCYQTEMTFKWVHYTMYTIALYGQVKYPLRSVNV